MKLITNPTAIFEAIVAQGLSMAEAAEKADIHTKSFSTLANHRKTVTAKTAAKLRRAFGDSAVIFSISERG